MRVPRLATVLAALGAVLGGASSAWADVAAVRGTNHAMERTVIRTSQAPAAIGPYSQAVVVPVGGDRMIFCSGQIPLDPATGLIVEGDIEVQTRRVLDNITAVLAAAGAGWEHIVKTTIFLADLGDFGAVNALYGARFGGAPPPARSTVQAAKLPRDARIEVEVIAVVPAGA